MDACAGVGGLSESLASGARVGSGADLAASFTHVRFTPNSGHQAGRLRCPLSAIGDIFTAQK